MRSSPILLFLALARMAGAYSFDLAVVEKDAESDGMPMKLHFFVGDDDRYFFRPSNAWVMKNETPSSLTITDPKIPTARIVVNFQPAFTEKDEALLRAQIITDAVADLQIEDAATRAAFNIVPVPGRPANKLYQVMLNHNKYNRPTTRVGLYYQMKEGEILRVRMSLPADKANEILASVKKFLFSIRSLKGMNPSMAKKPAPAKAPGTSAPPAPGGTVAPAATPAKVP